MATLLEQLKKMTVVVADTGDFQSIEKFAPRDATTNPSLLTTAAKMDAYKDVLDEAIASAKKDASEAEKNDKKKLAGLVIDRLAVGFGKRILKIIPGRVSTEVDARLSYDTKASIDKAHDIIAAYAKDGIGKDRILVKLASTWEGMRAAESLEKEGIHCNMTLLFGMHQAVAAAEAKVTLISPFVGRILDWYKKDSGKTEYAPSEDPGVVSVTKIFNYYKKHGYKTEVMGASFRNMGEITELAGCDLLTISPQLLGELQAASGELPKKLDAEAAKKMDLPKITVDEKAYAELHEKDRMAKDKLAEGIQGFIKAFDELETAIIAKL